METEQAKRKTDRMLSRDYLEGIEDLSFEALKARRDESLAVEQEISYGRRLLQGKLDILKHALEEGGREGQASTRSVIDQLPAILADPGGKAVPIRHSPIAAPAEATGRRREMERLASEVADIETMAPEDLSEAIGRLSRAEKRASEDRKKVQAVIDSLNEELVKRLKEQSGEPAPE